MIDDGSINMIKSISLSKKKYWRLIIYYNNMILNG